MTTRQDDAALACLAWYAEDMFDLAGPLQLTPTPDPRLAADGWQLRGYLSGLDAYVRLKQKSLLGARRFYGFLVESTLNPGNFAIAVRGTMNILEWFEDIEGEPVVHPDRGCGRVHLGFWDIYASFEYEDLLAVILSPVTALKAVITGPVTVVGHSLGTALATYLAFDLARAGLKVSVRLLAPPRPGDADFAKAFKAGVPDHVAYAYSRDLVPRVPVFFGYCPLPNLTVLEPGAVDIEVENGPLCNHHCACYVGMLDRSLLTPARIQRLDQQYVSCLPDLRLSAA